MSNEEFLVKGLVTFSGHIMKYERKFKSKGKQPRDKDWRPVRFAVRDIILANVVTRLQAKDNVIEVDVCLTYDSKAISGLLYNITIQIGQVH